jgi:hypothetical protein
MMRGGLTIEDDDAGQVELWELSQRWSEGGGEEAKKVSWGIGC